MRVDTDERRHLFWSGALPVDPSTATVNLLVNTTPEGEYPMTWVGTPTVRAGTWDVQARTVARFTGTGVTPEGGDTALPKGQYWAQVRFAFQTGQTVVSPPYLLHVN